MSESPYLYHGTGIYPLASIIATASLLEGTYWGKPGEPHGPRLTRDYTVATEFIRYGMHWGEGGVLVLDRAALLRDFEIVQYTDHFYDGGQIGQEHEEVPLTPMIEDLDRYIVSIQCDRRVMRYAIDDEVMEDAFNESGWCWQGVDDNARREARRALQLLAQHPKLNVLEESHALPLLGNWRFDARKFQPRSQGLALQLSP